jgi:hypothetical protein
VEFQRTYKAKSSTISMVFSVQTGITSFSGK